MPLIFLISRLDMAEEGLGEIEDKSIDVVPEWLSGLSPCFWLRS